MNIQILKVSPLYTIDKLQNPSFDDLVDVFEDRTRGWLIDTARALNQLEHAGFAVLQVLLAYFEGHAIYEFGEDSQYKSQEFFKSTFLQVFPEIINYGNDRADQIIDLMYTDARCGLYHTGMPRRGLILNDGSPTIRVLPVEGPNVDAVVVDRHTFVDRVEEHMEAYVARLRDLNETDLRTNFKTAWDLAHKE